MKEINNCIKDIFFEGILHYLCQSITYTVNILYYIYSTLYGAVCACAFHYLLFCVCISTSLSTYACHLKCQTCFPTVTILCVFNCDDAFVAIIKLLFMQARFCVCVCVYVSLQCFCTPESALHIHISAARLRCRSLA